MEISTKSGPSECLNRDELIKILSFSTKKLYDRISKSERFRVRNGDSTYLAYIRALASIATALNSIMRDNELQELEQRLEEIEKRVIL